MPLVAGKCKFYSPDKIAWEDLRSRVLIPKNLRHMLEGKYANNDGDNQRGVHVLDVLVGLGRLCRSGADDID